MFIVVLLGGLAAIFLFFFILATLLPVLWIVALIWAMYFVNFIAPWRRSTSTRKRSKS